MNVYKFGGASIEHPTAMRRLLPIIQQASTPLVIVVSAYGKTTNALEKIAAAAASNDLIAARSLLQDLEEGHNAYAKDVLGKELFLAIQPKLEEFYTELAWAIDDAATQSKNYVYDQIVCVGELLSTTIFATFLKGSGIDNNWVDARDIIRTNSNYKDPDVDIPFTTKQVQQIIAPLLLKCPYVITQGFIGSTDENHSTTLGREGSDYSAALLASMLKADAVSIWKDVKGLYNADPRIFPNAVKIDETTYYEVIEMAYYGAQVIHPKTIKPLENANIPLYVKCFLDPSLSGTCIKKTTDTFVYPPIFVLKKQQTLIQLTSKDFSFITEDNISKIYNLFVKYQVKMNLIQNAAISLVVCVEHDEDKLIPLRTALEQDYKVLQNDDVQLLTIRHFTPSTLEELTKGREVLLEQKTRSTVRVVLK